VSTPHATTVHPQGGGLRRASLRGASVERAQGRIGLVFVSLYALFLLAFGVMPSLYAVFLAFTVYNDIIAYRTAVAAGKPAVINFLLGLVLVFLGTPLYFYYRSRRGKSS